jgi:hypothetical protein
MAERDIAEHVGDDHHQDKNLSFSGMRFPEVRAPDWLQRNCLHRTPKDFG